MSVNDWHEAEVLAALRDQYIVKHYGRIYSCADSPMGDRFGGPSVVQAREQAGVEFDQMVEKAREVIDR